MAVENPHHASESGARLLMFSAVTSASVGVVSVTSNFLLMGASARMAWQLIGGLFAVASAGGALLAAFGFARLRSRVAFPLLITAAALSLLYLTLRVAGVMPPYGSWLSTLAMVTRLAIVTVAWYLGCAALLRALHAAGVRPGGGVIALVALSLAWNWVDPLADLIHPGLFALGGWRGQLILSGTLDLIADTIPIVAFALAAGAFARARPR